MPQRRESPGPSLQRQSVTRVPIPAQPTSQDAHGTVMTPARQGRSPKHLRALQVHNVYFPAPATSCSTSSAAAAAAGGAALPGLVPCSSRQFSYSLQYHEPGHCSSSSGEGGGGAWRALHVSEEVRHAPCTMAHPSARLPLRP